LADRNHNLKLRHQGWFLQVNVPPDVRHAFPSANGKPRERIIESLHTRDVVAARELRDIRLGEWRTRFAKARAGITVSAEDIAAEVEYARRRRSGFSTIATDSVLEDEFGPDIADIARRKGWTLTPGTQTWRQVALALAQAYAEDRHRDVVEAQGEIPALMVPTLAEASPAAPLAVRLGGGTPFSITAAKYLEEVQRDKSARLKEATRAQYETAFRLFRDFTEDRPLATVDHKTASEFLDAVAKLDSTWGRHADVKTRTLAQLLELFGGNTGRPKLSNPSINRYCRYLQALFKWAQSRGDVDHERKNPFADRHRKRGKSNGWLPYTVDELNQLFSASLFQVPRAERIRPKQFGIENALRWAPLIALFTGMRIEEICQLQVADLKHESGIWFFNVVEGAGQSLKTENATRRVPVHAELVALGLLEYAKRLPADGPLLPGLSRTGVDGKSSTRVSHRFGQFKVKAGVTRARLSFHSFRKTVTTALDHAGVPENDVNAVLGWSRGFGFDTYSGGPGLKRLAAIVAKIEYPGLRLPK
jgi:integrase